MKSLSKYILRKSPRWASYISLHAYGGVWLAPFSYSKTHIQDNFEETVKILFYFFTIKQFFLKFKKSSAKKQQLPSKK
jgi:hypothetical protein